MSRSANLIACLIAFAPLGIVLIVAARQWRTTKRQREVNRKSLEEFHALIEQARASAKKTS